MSQIGTVSTLVQQNEIKEEEKEKKKEKNDCKEMEGQNEIEKNSSKDNNSISTEVGQKIKSESNDSNLNTVRENDKKLNDIQKDMQTDKNTKFDSGNEEESDVPPELPPRPPLRPRQHCSCTCNMNETYIGETNERRIPRSCWSSGLRKYVFLCTACGSLSILLGTLFLTVYFILKSYTSSLNHFETIPTYVPSGMLIATGFLIISLACRKNRNSFLMKLCGLCSFCCAVLCVSVTVTTTVIHMNRLQTLRECLYTQKTQSCTCYSVLIDNDRISDEGIKFVFNSTPDCEVIHGALYSCLRAIFGLSVIGILVCIFSCMLVYQLLSHEKKKMYWAQLEMRCRYLYRQQRSHYYSCCDECRYPPHPHELFPWEMVGNRIWSTGRIGNLYTPNPEDGANHNRLRSGWNWRRLPWSRGRNSHEPTRANLGSPDSQYGFSSTGTIDGGPYTVLDPRSSSGMTTCPTGMPITEIGDNSFYSWGPPPPYASNRNSANNSPARRSLGELLHHVSPIRRNDNVSPAGPVHHVHRHHLHHSHPCNTSPRQMTNNLLPSDQFPKDISTRNSPITRQQPPSGLEQSWTNNFSTPNRFPKVVQNKSDYENVYSQENLSPGGFNTLPSLKKRNQVKVSNFFQNETSTAYIFSSAENLGCSTSNLQAENQGQNKSLPPRIYLSSGQPNTSTYSPINVSVTQNYESKNQSDSEFLNSTNQHLPGNLEVNDGLSTLRPLRSLERNTSLVRKLFVNYSPTKEKVKSSQDSPTYSEKKKENLRPIQVQKKKSNKKLEPPPNFGDKDPNENIITFHYRVGIPRSPNIKNFNQFSAPEVIPESGGQLENCRDIAENWPKEKATDSKIEANKVPKCMKYVAKDVELLQKHNILIKEFNKNLDLERSLKSKGNADVRKSKGIKNEGFRRSEDLSREVVKPCSKKTQGNLTYNLNGHSQKNQGARLNKMPLVKEVESKEEFVCNIPNVNENESDIYFADVSNSSCYMSVQNDEPDSLIYEETSENTNIESRKTNSFQTILGKQHLKVKETQNQGYQERIHEYKPCFDTRQQYSEITNFDRRQNLESFQYGYRQNRGNNQYRDPNKELIAEEFHARPLHQESKPQRWPYVGPLHLGSEKDNKAKYFTPINGESLQDSHLNPDHHHESANSTDEQSLSSLTADSGISSGKNFMSNCFENTYQELDYSSKDKDLSCVVVAHGSEKVGEQHSHFPKEINNGFGNFAHPLFQKPKVLPRGNRFKESELRQIKMLGVDESIRSSDLELKDKNLGSRLLGNLPKLKNLEKSEEEVSNQLLNTCSLTLSNDADLFLEDGLQFNTQDEILSAQKENFEEKNKKLPKPLPRTSVLNKNIPESNKILKYSQNKEKISHFSAPEAQY